MGGGQRAAGRDSRGQLAAAAAQQQATHAAAATASRLAKSTARSLMAPARELLCEQQLGEGRVRLCSAPAGCARPRLPATALWPDV